jgi:hypothetical protein
MSHSPTTAIGSRQSSSSTWLYMRFTLSLRDVEDMLAERGLDLSYKTVRRWSANSARCSRATFGGGGHAQLRAGTWTRW